MAVTNKHNKKNQQLQKTTDSRHQQPTTKNNE